MRTILLVLLVSGCAGMPIDSHTPPPTNWPKLDIQEIRVSDGEVRRVCGTFAQACALISFTQGWCRVILRFDAPKSVIEHEYLHCRGFDHIGSDNLKNAFLKWGLDK